MSGREALKKTPDPRNVREVRVDIVKPQRHAHRPATVLSTVEDSRGIAKISSRNMDYVYVNSAYMGSMNSVSDRRRTEPTWSPPTEVYREQYWACTRWPAAQKILALAVGVLIGACISLTLIFTLQVDKDDVIGGIFLSGAASKSATE